eukprot:1160961-Pelagomonas_calceolata.AAC.10
MQGATRTALEASLSLLRGVASSIQEGPSKAAELGALLSVMAMALEGGSVRICPVGYIPLPLRLTAELGAPPYFEALASDVASQAAHDLLPMTCSKVAVHDLLLMICSAVAAHGVTLSSYPNDDLVSCLKSLNTLEGMNGETGAEECCAAIPLPRLWPPRYFQRSEAAQVLVS